MLRPPPGDPERRLLDSCLANLPLGLLDLLYLSFYARLNVRQITLIERRFTRGWTAADTTSALQQAWRTVVDNM